MMFPEKVRKLLALRRLSQADAAASLDVSQNLVSRWTTGKNTPDIFQGRALAAVLGVSLDYLVDDSLDDPPTPSGLSPDADRLLSVFHALNGGVSPIGLDEAIRRLTLAGPYVVQYLGPHDPSSR